MQYRQRHVIPILAMAILAALSAGWADSFPDLSVQTLSGSPFRLPGDLPADITILVVGFTRKAGANTHPWVERLRQDFTAEMGFSVYSVAVLAGVPALFRPLAVSAIRGSVPPADQASFLIADHDESSWRLLAGYQTPDDPCIVAIDKQGTVLARGSGLFDERIYADAAARIRSAATRKE